VTVPDSELIARVLLNDDRNAFAALVRRYQSNVRGLLRKLSQNNHALADDLAQETFIKVYQSLASFRGSAKFSTWLHRIAYNLFISHVRSERPQESFDEAEHSGMQRHHSLSGAVLKHDLEAALHTLTDSEAADILDQPVGTIKTHIARGKEKLRRILSVWQESVI
jgi:DNA-directed RNA polymerase specialized sigma24 family protein